MLKLGTAYYGDHTQRLLQALLLTLLLGAAQLLLATHSHADDTLQHESCVLCHQHGSGFDFLPATTPLPEAVPATLQLATPAGTLTSRRAPRPRSRSPPITV